MHSATLNYLVFELGFALGAAAELHPGAFFMNVEEFFLDFFVGVAGVFDHGPELHPLVEVNLAVVVFVDVVKHSSGVDGGEVVVPPALGLFHVYSETAVFVWNIF